MASFEGVARGSFAGKTTVKKKSTPSTPKKSSSSGGGGGGGASSSPTKASPSPSTPGQFKEGFGSGGTYYVTKGGKLIGTSGTAARKEAQTQQAIQSSPQTEPQPAAAPSSSVQPGPSTVINPYSGERIDIAAQRNAREAFYAAGYRPPQQTGELSLQRQKYVFTLKGEGDFKAIGFGNAGRETAGNIKVYKKTIAAGSEAEARFAGLPEKGVYQYTYDARTYQPRQGFLAPVGKKLEDANRGFSENLKRQAKEYEEGNQNYIAAATVVKLSEGVERFGARIRTAGERGVQKYPSMGSAAFTGDKAARLEGKTAGQRLAIVGGDTYKTGMNRLSQGTIFAGSFVETLGLDVRERPGDLLVTAGAAGVLKTGIETYKVAKRTRIVFKSEKSASKFLTITSSRAPSTPFIKVTRTRTPSTPFIKVTRTGPPESPFVTITRTSTPDKKLTFTVPRPRAPSAETVIGVGLAVPFIAATGAQVYRARDDPAQLGRLTARTGEDVLAFGAGYKAGGALAASAGDAISVARSRAAIRSYEKKYSGQLTTPQTARELQAFRTDLTEPVIVVQPLEAIQTQRGILEVGGRGEATLFSKSGTRLGPSRVLLPEELPNPLQQFRITKLERSTDLLMKERRPSTVLDRAAQQLSTDRAALVKGELRVTDVGLTTAGKLAQRVNTLERFGPNTPRVEMPIESELPLGLRRARVVDTLEIFQPVKVGRAPLDAEIRFEPLGQERGLLTFEQRRITGTSQQRLKVLSGPAPRQTLEFIQRDLQIINLDTGKAIEGVAYPSRRLIVRDAPLVIKSVKLRKKPFKLPDVSQKPRVPLNDAGLDVQTGGGTTLRLMPQETQTATKTKVTTIQEEKRIQGQKKRSGTKGGQKGEQKRGRKQETIKPEERLAPQTGKDILREPFMRATNRLGSRGRLKPQAALRPAFSSAQTSRSEYTFRERTLPKQDILPGVRITPRQDTIQEQQRETRERRPFPFVPVTPRPTRPQRDGLLEKTITPTLPPKLPRLGSDAAPGFDVFVKQKGRFTKVSKTPLSSEEALALGKRKVKGTIAASFKVTGSGGNPLNPREGLGALGPEFRLSKTDSDVFVQRSEYRLSSLGEKQDIRAAQRPRRGRLRL